MPAVDVFVDYSGLAADIRLASAIARLDGADVLGSIAARVTCVVPAGVTGTTASGLGAAWTIRTAPPIAACGRAMALAAETNRPLLVLIGDLEPSCEAVGLMLDAVGGDPMIGFACPRLTGPESHSIARLDAGSDRAIDQLPRRLLAELPECYLTADTPARCLLVAPTILANFGGLHDRFRTLAGALCYYVARARRCGFRTLVCNRAVVFASPAAPRPHPPSAITLAALPEADRTLLRELRPDVERVQEEFGAWTLARGETRLARAMPQAYGARPSLLLDARNIIAGMNGTAVSALGISGGLHALDAHWDVTLLASREANAFHQLEPLFPRWKVVTRLPRRQFTVALRLSQPWQIQEMLDLHDLSLYNVYLFLDTIAWDIAYPAPHCLDGTWRFMADQADGLVFISDFTRQRFYRRFPAGADRPSLVSYLSCDPADYVRPDLPMGPNDKDYIFVVGNAYDHKDVAHTIELLTTAFPYQAIVALGPAPAPTPRVSVLESGTLSEDEVHRVYASARAVVFPSFYEGFGFPILTTLAYGRTLLARRSALLDEIAARCPHGGRIVPFDRREQLVELIGRLLHDEDVPRLRLGTALENGRPKSWTDVGEDILRFLADLAGDLSLSRWRSRDHVMRQLMAAPTSLVERGLTPPSLQ